MKTKKECLKEIVKAFVLEIDKLADVERTVLNRNYNGSLFLNNDDVERIKARKKVMEGLFDSITAQIFEKSSLKEKYLPVNYNKNQKVDHLGKGIDTLDDKKAGEILHYFLQQAEEIVNKPENQKALKEHSFSDKWVFNFLAKLVKTVREVLGMKTTSEKLLEESKEKASNFKDDTAPSGENGMKPPGL
ncbi:MULTISPECIES: hypothetical protein [unclassified Legionella]|uniref:hypothetical protein n=1 Tax=unclassified Legionella TaxID=2622702 RepID=UPI001055F68C|nr:MULTISPECIES: hypothetical protein [unclassified Legionella]MDI9819348.1 hypothetical protein [Legionella sp. PL877]